MDIIAHDIQNFPPINLACLEYFSNLVDKISANYSVNQMNYSNIAICIAPSLARFPEISIQDEMTEMVNLTHYITVYFENHKKLARIFE